MRSALLLAAAVAVLAAGCAAPVERAARVEQEAPAEREYYGTLEPFAAEAVYFLLTDRFVDGDPGNNFPEQGGGPETRSFDRPMQVEGYAPANVGYLGGDLKGVLDNAQYIADMGFTAIWTTPIVDNPDEAFTGSRYPGRGPGGDRGKTGYHGYWGVDFFEVDEHLESDALTFADFTRRLQDEYGLKYVLDVVCNHGSPAWTMPQDQPMFGELYDADGVLVADHGNLHPGALDDDNPLHAYFNREPGLAELADLNEDNPDVLEYFVAAYSQWLEQGVAAFRIDTIAYMKHAYWKRFSDRIRAQRPGLFMFAEHFSYDATSIAEHTWPENGAISVLDFPGREAMNRVFADGASYSELESYQHLESGLYQNPYELMTFYDNHDMDRMDADSNGFIDANNWLFTSRGIPVVYYGSEIGFQAGTNEHTGNRNYLGQDAIDGAQTHAIHNALTRIANVRRNSVALQRGLQVNRLLGGNVAVFYRVYEKDDVAQTALVVLNKSDQPARFMATKYLSPGTWRDAMTGQVREVDAALPGLDVRVEPHGVRVLLQDAPVVNPRLASELDRLQATARRRTP
ncbi:MAG: cyclomaltodextrin glucanotransferase [Gammaproteobacteria bacterium]|nr:cyclomaltodextrin glucanotransferase [Gammaproteobacteria bacterium]MBT8094720.1 cyclomaltodextrin glucanotransferase [Gammaproteobacteria bacterium]MBT8104317.1 cyclomaltodextrin glucanotransferase [Gammaproteobacteria bacterium]NNK24333.1 cyclomaltodextrin glucanotransferase [Woeseiaceae bacterium]